MTAPFTEKQQSHIIQTIEKQFPDIQALYLLEENNVLHFGILRGRTTKENLLLQAQQQLQQNFPASVEKSISLIALRDTALPLQRNFLKKSSAFLIKKRTATMLFEFFVQQKTKKDAFFLCF